VRQSLRELSAMLAQGPGMPLMPDAEFALAAPEPASPRVKRATPATAKTPVRGAAKKK
jgi:hypothetical protein